MHTIERLVGLLFFWFLTLLTPTGMFAQGDPDYQNEVERNTVCSFINANNVNIRKKPNPNSSIVAKLNRGDVVRVVNRQGKWVWIAARDSGKSPTPYTPLQGYVSNRFINGCSEDQFDRWRK